MNKTQSNPRKFAENRQRIGNITFVVNAFDNPTATTAERLILSLLESKIKEAKTA